MALIHSLENDGNWLFKRRGQIPVVLFILAIPAVYVTNYDDFDPRIASFLNYSAAILSILGAVIRAYTIGTTPRGTSGRNTHAQVAESLNTSGIYSIVRHPLYLGNYLMWIGIVLFTRNIEFTIIVSLLYWIYYERIMFAEERFLERKFGDVYLDWSKKVPAFFPKISQFRKSETGFSMKSVLRREYSGILATVFGFLYVELLMSWFRWETISIGKNLIYLFIATLLITIVLRTLKHNTKLLEEEGRS
ncbi:MAG TPA: isoprenylcysteine carboxylmethyltransferase family protein [Bacteroidia bacterium]|nr:isoprenylcysteine carboxylmethyltransferase family protein [Bacteroidia bacterium]HNS11136.1 isoprenylcysteine carboxylmethyltransferase family protein [Bacteroidia bacterium]